ncbi:hypothetical protein BH10PSE7_BH10PSE7_15140 [soil metagenome]
MDSPSPVYLYPGCTAVQSLELATDGRIDARLRTACEKYDAEIFHRRLKPAAVNLTRIRLKRHVALCLMTRAIINALSAKGCVERDDLARAGVPADQIDALHDEALAMALIAVPGLGIYLGSAAA